MRNLIWMVAAALALAGCRRTDVRDFAIDVPGLTETDLPSVMGEFNKYAGIDKASVRFDAAKSRITLKYDSMQIAKKNIEMAIAVRGFTANGVTPQSIGATPKKR